MAKTFDAEARAVFLERLAETSNVASAARLAGVSRWVAYDAKQKDAAFRAAWEQALAIGYQELEMEMLNRARFGVLKRPAGKDGKPRAVREFSDAQGLRLLMAHKQEVLAVKAAAPMAGETSARDQLAAKLRAMRAAIEEAKQGDNDA